MSSRARLSLLAVTYLIDVKKDIGLKSPEIHRDFGAISSSLYSWSWATLSMRSSNQAPRAFKEK